MAQDKAHPNEIIGNLKKVIPKSKASIPPLRKCIKWEGHSFLTLTQDIITALLPPSPKPDLCSLYTTSTPFFYILVNSNSFLLVSQTEILHSFLTSLPLTPMLHSSGNPVGVCCKITSEPGHLPPLLLLPSRSKISWALPCSPVSLLVLLLSPLSYPSPYFLTSSQRDPL